MQTELTLGDTVLCLACGMALDACQGRCAEPPRLGEWLVQYLAEHGSLAASRRVTRTGDTESARQGEGV